MNSPNTSGFITRWRVKLEPAFLVLITPVVIIGYYIESVNTYSAVRIVSRVAMILVGILTIWYRVRPVPKCVLFKRSHVLIYWIVVGVAVAFLVVWAPTAEIYRRPILAALITVAVVRAVAFLIWKGSQSVTRN